MTVPSISVLMPFYNSAGTLPTTLRSITAQSQTAFEVIAIDDGSQDGDQEILKAWSQADHRIKLVSPGRIGLVPALNLGLSLSSGRYLARMDADDWMHPKRLDSQMCLLQANPDVSVVSSLVKFFSDDPIGEGMKIYELWLNSLVSHESISREIFIESPIPHPTAMVRRDELIDLGGYRDFGWPEDYDLWLRYYSAGRRFAKIPEVLLYWREHAARLTRTHPRYSVENFFRVKAHFLVNGPLVGRDGLIMWGAGQTGRRLSKQIERLGQQINFFVDVSPKKIGGKMRGRPVVSPQDIASARSQFSNPLLIIAVSSRGARGLIRKSLQELCLKEVRDYLCAA